MKNKNYSGSDLSQEFKRFARKEFKRITNVLTEKGCTNIQLNYGFYYFSGFFTAQSGQIYYISSYDVRHFGYKELMYRTAKSYTDYSGGSNNFVQVNKLDSVKFE